MGTTFVCLITQCLLLTTCIQQAITQPVSVPESSEEDTTLEPDLSDFSELSSSEIDNIVHEKPPFESTDSTTVEPLVTEPVLPLEEEKDISTTVGPLETDPVSSTEDSEENNEATVTKKSIDHKSIPKVNNLPDTTTVNILPLIDDSFFAPENENVPAQSDLSKEVVPDNESNVIPVVPIQSDITVPEENQREVPDTESDDESETSTPVKIHGTISISAHYGPKTTTQTITKPVVADTSRSFYNTPSNSFYPSNFCNDFYSLQFCQNFYNYFNNLWNYCGLCCSNNYLNRPCNYYYPNLYNFAGVGTAYGNVDISRRF